MIPVRSYRSTATHVKRCVLDHLQTGEDIEAFALWAWGPGFGSVPISQLDERWNALHVDELMVSGTDLIRDTVPIMVEIWRENNVKANSIQGFVRKHVGADRADDFAVWAWGPNYTTAPVSVFADLWNARHEHELRFNYRKPIEVELQKMIDLWDSKGRPVSTETVPAPAVAAAGLPIVNEQPAPVVFWTPGKKANAVIVLVIAIVVAVAFVLSSCAMYTYQGKAVPRAEADRMRDLGMDVVHPK